jgi:phage terminase small subunit
MIPTDPTLKRPRALRSKPADRDPLPPKPDWKSVPGNQGQRAKRIAASANRKSQKLTKLEASFVEAMRTCVTPGAALVAAGGSPNGAAGNAFEMQQRPRVKAALGAMRAEMRAEYAVTAEKVISRLAQIAFTDSRRLTQVKGGVACLTNTAELTKEEAALFVSAKTTRGKDGSPVTEIKLQDSLKAMELLGRHLGLFTDKVVQTNTNIALDSSALQKLDEADLAALEAILMKVGAK